MMNVEMLRALSRERQRELIRQASQHQAARSAGGQRGHVHDTGARGWRLPRYRVHWSRVTVAAIGGAGRRERSWVIVISATRGL
jgi:hypothetical protein